MNRIKIMIILYVWFKQKKWNTKKEIKLFNKGKFCVKWIFLSDFWNKRQYVSAWKKRQFTYRKSLPSLYYFSQRRDLHRKEIVGLGSGFYQWKWVRHLKTGHLKLLVAENKILMRVRASTEFFITNPIYIYFKWLKVKDFSSPQ